MGSYYGHTLSACLQWRSNDNIISRDPSTASRIVRGSIFQLETEFPMPPAYGFTPRYLLQVEFKRSFAAQFMQNLVCSEVNCDSSSAMSACGTSPNALKSDALETLTL